MQITSRPSLLPVRFSADAKPPEDDLLRRLEELKNQDIATLQQDKARRQAEVLDKVYLNKGDEALNGRKILTLLDAWAVADEETRKQSPDEIYIPPVEPNVDEPLSQLFSFLMDRVKENLPEVFDVASSEPETAEPKAFIPKACIAELDLRDAIANLFVLHPDREKVQRALVDLKIVGLVDQDFNSLNTPGSYFLTEDGLKVLASS